MPKDPLKHPEASEGKTMQDYTRKRYRRIGCSGCFIVTVLAWALIVFLTMPAPGRPWTRYSPDAYYNVVPGIVFLIGAAVLLGLMMLLQAIWDHLNPDQEEPHEATEREREGHEHD
jgi:hypothetical protein